MAFALVVYDVEQDDLSGRGRLRLAQQVRELLESEYGLEPAAVDIQDRRPAARATDGGET